MIESEFVTLVSNVGFPIAMVVWFMFRTEKVITNNTKAMTEVKTTMTSCHGRNQ